MSDTLLRQRQRQALRSPSGRAVLAALADNRHEAMTAGRLAAAAGVSTTIARDQAWRAAQLGYATQGSTTGPPPARTWQATTAGVQLAERLTDE